MDSSNSTISNPNPYSFHNPNHAGVAVPKEVARHPQGLHQFTFEQNHPHHSDQDLHSPMKRDQHQVVEKDKRYPTEQVHHHPKKQNHHHHMNHFSFEQDHIVPEHRHHHRHHHQKKQKQRGKPKQSTSDSPFETGANLYEEINDPKSTLNSSTLPPQLNPIAERPREPVRNYATDVKNKTRPAHQLSPQEAGKRRVQGKANLGFDEPTEEAHAMYGTKEYNPMKYGYSGQSPLQF